LNVALYGKSGHHWAMTERGTRTTERSATRFIIGPSDIKIEERGMTISIRERTTPFFSKMIGEVTLSPNVITDHVVALDPESTHHWRPVAPLAHIDVRFDHPRLAWSGHAYHDMNWGSRPLESTFDTWFWSRATSSEGAHIIYDKTLLDGSRSGFAIDIDDHGMIRERALPPETELGKSFWQMNRPARIDGPKGRVTLIEDSPFYTRSLVETRIGNEQVTAFHESLSLTRFKTPWMQKMLPFRMPRWDRV
jgi:carotenoid 1,2-hydratase